MISRHQAIVIVIAAVSVLPAQLDSDRVHAVYDQAAQWLASTLGFSHSTNPRDLSYYLAIEVTPAQRDRGLIELKRAISAADARQTTAAVQSFDRAAELLPNLGDWVSLFAASAAAAAGDTAEVSRRLERADSLLTIDWAWRTRVRAYRNALDPAGALRLATAAASLPGSPRRRSEARRAQGEILLGQADTAGAAQAFSQAIDAWPYSDAALEAARLLSELPGLNPEQHLRIGRTYLRFGNFRRGVGSLDIYLASNIPADSAARVRLEIGRAYFDARDYDRARELLVAAARDSSAVSATALYMAARAQYRSGNQDEGRATLERVVASYPRDFAAAQALVLLADLSQDDFELEPAETYFREATRLAPGSELAALAHMRISSMAWARGDYPAAAALFSGYRSEYPSGPRHQQATFWLGRAHQAAGNQEQGNTLLREARDLDPFSFYGMRAAEVMGEVVAAERLAEDPVTPEPSARIAEAALQRHDLMRAVGWNEAANLELDRIRQHFTDQPAALYALAEGLNERNRINVGISIGRQLYATEGRWSRRLLRIVYPLPYRDLIEKHARSQNIDPFFMAALIRQESMFNPVATSSAGARGLMQVMPATGRSLAPSLGIRRFNPGMLHTPDTNLRIGARFLAGQIRTWGGRTDYVLAAYNAGPTRMQRWRQFPEAADPDLFLERIPFEETRDYVRIVQLNARIYSTLYGPREAR